MRRVSTLGLIILSIVTFATTAIARTAASPARRASLPRNVVIDDRLRAQVEDMAALSPTLSRQFAAIDAAAASVEIRVWPGSPSASRRAEATISRYTSGYIRAQLFVSPNWEFVELLAHELEHVVEQIERVDLAALARAGVATQDAFGRFETVRARDAGRAAASEVEEALRAADAAER